MGAACSCDDPPVEKQSQLEITSQKRLFENNPPMLSSKTIPRTEASIYTGFGTNSD